MQPMDQRLRELRTRLRWLAAILLECRFFLPTQTRAMLAALIFSRFGRGQDARTRVTEIELFQSWNKSKVRVLGFCVGL